MKTIIHNSAAVDVRFATTEGAEFAIDWMLRELIALNPAGEAHYRKVARSPAAAEQILGHTVMEASNAE